MCGICGLVHPPGGETPSRRTVERMVAALAHRGPDDQGFHAGGPAVLGHARLSIIDLEGGRQPLGNEDGSVQVVANGEIYNFAALRDELVAGGHRFRSRSDCEVLVHLWEDEGPDMLGRLRGMFAFALHDRRAGILFGARDRFGQKPLFYHWDGKTLAFASEIKALLVCPHIPRRLDRVALDQYLFYQFVPHPRTLIEGIRQLPPAHFLIYRQAALTVERYWRPPVAPEENDEGMGDTGHLARLEAALAGAVASHMVSDVPVGIFLSGGIDSSLVGALAARSSSEPLRSFSIAFPGERYDESSFARSVSRHLGTRHEEYPFEPGHIEERLERLARTFDQPLADRAAMPLLYLSEQASRRIKVVLTGDGGDELFGGYEKYRRAARVHRWAARLDRALPGLLDSGRLARCGRDRFGLRRLRSRLALALLPPRQCAYFKHFWEGWDRKRLYSPELARLAGGGFEAVDARLPRARRTADPLDAMLELDQLAYLPDDLLLKTDYCTMAWGLEARAPLLDHELAACAARLPRRLKATAGETKVALRRIAARLLPREIAERPKQGFGVPLPAWFRGELRGWLRRVLVESSATVPALFRAETVAAILEEHASGRRNRASKIYSLLVFELWYRTYLR